MKLTLKHIADIITPTGVVVGRLTDWVDRGFITPTEGAGVQGRTRRFTVMQAVGIVVTTYLYTSGRGCVLPFVKAVVDAFSKVEEDWLLKEFKAGRTEFMTVHQGRPVLDGKRPYDTVSVKDAFEAVMKCLQQVEVNN